MNLREEEELVQITRAQKETIIQQYSEAVEEKVPTTMKRIVFITRFYQSMISNEEMVKLFDYFSTQFLIDFSKI